MIKPVNECKTQSERYDADTISKQANYAAELYNRLCRTLLGSDGAASVVDLDGEVTVIFNDYLAGNFCCDKCGCWVLFGQQEGMGESEIKRLLKTHDLKIFAAAAITTMFTMAAKEATKKHAQEMREVP